jgi:chromate transporter
MRRESSSTTGCPPCQAQGDQSGGGHIAGATLAAVGIFLPVYVFTVVPAPWFTRHRHNPQLRALASGATAAASGAIAGAVIVLGRQALIDAATVSIAIAGLGSLLRFRFPEPPLVLGAGVAGLALSRV